MTYTGQVQVDFTHNPGDAAHTWVDITNRARAASYRRGRSYERGVIDPGNGSLKLRNDDGALDPTNGSSTFSPNVLPFKRIQHNVTVTGPGTVPIFTGMVERWPQEWDNGYGYAPVAVVDFLTWLGASKLHSALIHEMLSDSPSALYPLDEAAGSTSFGGLMGNPSAVVTDSKYGAAGVTAGTPVALTTGVAFTNASLTSPQTVITLPAAAVAVGAAFTFEAWIVTTAAPGVAQTIVEAVNPSSTRLIGLTTSGTSVSVIPSAGSGISASVTANDGNPHHVVGTYDGVTLRIYFDGALGNSAARGATSFTPTTGYVGGSLNFGNALEYGFTGTVSGVAIYPTALSAARVLAHYNAGKTAFAGDTADARIARILGYAGWAATTSLDACTTTMLAADIAGGSALDAINAVATSEGGTFFAAKDGTLTYRSRRTRMQTTASAVTFGDGTSETPYLDIAFDFDPTRVYNDIQITRASVAAATAKSSASQAKYGLRSLAESVETQSDSEATDEANWTLNSFADPHARVRSITVDALATPGAWAALLPLEIGSRVTVKRRPVGRTITVNSFVESIGWDIVDGRSAKCTLELSPIPLQALIADDAVYGICDSTFVAAW